MKEFESNNQELLPLIEEWEKKFLALSEDVISNRRNSQNRNIKQVVGHMIDSASNNTHRIIHLQYRESPVKFPNYATYGNNDRWIAIQNYENEDWYNMVQLWKYSNLHIIHVIRNVDGSKLENLWEADTDKFISLHNGIADYTSHFKLHIREIEELINQK